MINRVILVGRLTRDPELRKTASGTSVCSFTLAVNRRTKTPGQPDADFISCTAWGKTAELVCQYLHKGSLIGVEGRIQTSSYDNQQGQKVYRTDVVCESVQFLESKSASSQYQQGGYPDNGWQNPQQGYGNNSYGSSYGSAPAYNSYQSNGGYSNSSSYQQSPQASQASPFAASQSNGFDNAFDDSDTLDIASDDLPF